MLDIGNINVLVFGSGIGTEGVMSFVLGTGAEAAPPITGGGQTSFDSGLICKMDCNTSAVGCWLPRGSSEISFFGKENGTDGAMSLFSGMGAIPVLSEAPYSLISLLHFKTSGSGLGKGTNGAISIEQVN